VLLQDDLHGMQRQMPAARHALPLCRAPIPTSDAEVLRRLQKHVDKGNNAEAHIMLGCMYRDGDTGLPQNFRRAVQLFELVAAQGNARAQDKLGSCYALGQDHKTAVQWWRRAAEQGFPPAQYNRRSTTAGAWRSRTTKP
jgi:TPR repeat protein